MIEDNDKKLVQDCLKGSRVAFEKLVDNYQKTIFNTVYRMIHNFDDAEDIAQRIFIKVFENLNSYNPKYKFFSWMYRIAMNESINHIKQKKSMAEISDDMVSKEKKPDELFNGSELSTNIQRALMDINPDHRQIIILKHFQDCSYKEIAIILKINEKTVKSRLYTARQLLKDMLLKMGVVSNDS